MKYSSIIDVTRFDENTGAQKSVPIDYKFVMRIYKNQSNRSICPICKKMNVVPLAASGICD